MEIERRFLIKNLNNLNLLNYKHKQIIQDYLYIDLFTAIRKRKIIEYNSVKYTYTVKTNKIGISINEIEKEITEKEYNQLNLNPNFNQIDKIRYIIPYKENLNIELDVFNKNYSGIIFAEIEFKNEKQANIINLPNWFGNEISNKITNSDMACKSIDEIFQIIQQEN